MVDNSSEVQHLKNVEFWIESNGMKNYELRMSNENLGYSGGNNIGIKRALEKGAEQILILNNDVILHELPTATADITGLEAGNVFGLDYVSGAAMLVRRQVFEKIGLLDERYFLYYEDVEFCVRAKKAGFTLSGSTAQFTHAVSASTSSLGAANLLYYHTRNALLLLKTHASWHIRAALPLWQFWIKLKQHAKLLFGREPEISRAILQGVKDYENNRFGAK